MSNSYRLRWFRYGALALLLVPVVCSAQLSSTNYQVEVFGVGEERGGTATSTQYRVDGVVGSALEYDPATTVDTNGSSVGGGSRARADEEGVDEVSSSTPVTAPPLPVGVERMSGLTPTPVPSSEASDLSLPGDVVSDGGSYLEPESSEDPAQAFAANTPGACTGFLDCYGFPLTLVTVVSVALVFYFRRAR